MRTTILSVASVIIFGIIDQFTARIIPAIVREIDNYIYPPRFIIRFVPAVDLSAGFTVTALDSEPTMQVAVKETELGSRVFRAQAGAGNYLVRLTGGSDKAGKELVDLNKIQNSGDTWNIDTSNERLWASAQALTQPLTGAPDPSATPQPNAGAEALSASRWPAAASDFQVVATVQDPVLRSMLANALAEVGVFEDGTEREKRRIISYSASAGFGNLTTHVPWGATFIGWVTKQAGAEPPNNAGAFASWRNWDEEVAPAKMTPGMVAIFRWNGNRALAGIMLRRQASCIEVVMGNVAHRVVISCVADHLLDGARRPAPIPASMPSTSERLPKGE